MGGSEVQGLKDVENSWNNSCRESLSTSDMGQSSSIEASLKLGLIEHIVGQLTCLCPALGALSWFGTSVWGKPGEGFIQVGVRQLHATNWQEQRCLGYSLDVIVMRAHGISAVTSKSEYRKELTDWSVNSRWSMLSGRVGPIEPKTWRGAIGTTEWKSRDVGSVQRVAVGLCGWNGVKKSLFSPNCFPGRLRIPFS